MAQQPEHRPRGSGDIQDDKQFLSLSQMNRSLGPVARSNLVIALGDLAVRFPNVSVEITARNNDYLSKDCLLVTCQS
jgi:hypothetical protein